MSKRVTLTLNEEVYDTFRQAAEAGQGSVENAILTAALAGIQRERTSQHSPPQYASGSLRPVASNSLSNEELMQWAGKADPNDGWAEDTAKISASPGTMSWRL